MVNELFFYISMLFILLKKRFHNQNSVFYDIKFAFIRGNVSVATTQSLRFYDVKFTFLYRNGNAV